jgi:hypothetical protein
MILMILMILFTPQYVTLQLVCKIIIIFYLINITFIQIIDFCYPNV